MEYSDYVEVIKKEHSDLIENIILKNALTQSMHSIMNSIMNSKLHSVMRIIITRQRILLQLPLFSCIFRCEERNNSKNRKD
jgi:hypothetical protein